MENSHFLFVGTAKAGTTSLYNYLLQHPEIEIPVKETFFFLKDVYKDLELGYPWQRSADDLILDKNSFKSIYPNNSNKVYGEIGTGYLYHYSKCIPLIKEYLGDRVKIIILLRNPIDRAYSSYMHFVKDAFEKNSFEEAIELEEKRKSLNYDFMWLHQELGLYFEQVKAYKDAFPSVKVLTIESFLEDEEEHLRALFKYIGVNPDVHIVTKKKYNQSGQPKSKSLQRFMLHEHRLKKIIRPIFRSIYGKEKRAAIRKKIKNMNIGTYKPMDMKTRTKLGEFYKEDIRKLEHLLSREFTEWKES